MLEGETGPRVAAGGLVLANLVPLVGVLALGWNLHSLLVVYWLESGAVGVLSVLKILRATGEDDPEDLPQMSFNDRSVASFVGDQNGLIAAFFLSHYGFFWLVHGSFVLLFPRLSATLTAASVPVVALGTVGLLAYHAISYRANFVGQREYERRGPVTLMVDPYRRVLVLHLTILLGALGVAAIGAPVAALVVMVLIKTVLDFRGHWKEHDRAQERFPVPTPTG